MAVFTPAAAANRYTPVNTVPAPGTASGAANPAYTGVFIPQIWSSKLIEKFYDATVLAVIANTDYEGEVQSYGDTIHMRTRPDVTIKDYVPDMVLEVERPSSPMITMEINQAHYFNCILDDIYKTQADLDMMNLWAEDASERMKIRVDQNVLAGVPLAAAATNRGDSAGRISGDIDLGVTGTPVTVEARNAQAGNVEVIDIILRMAQCLDEHNIPENGRFLIIPAWMSSIIKRSELRDASLTGDGQSMLRNGRLGMIDRFTLYMSNLMPNPGATGEHYLLAGNTMGLTFAAQLTEMETLRAESTFGNLMRGLFVYGSQVIKDDCLVTAVVAKA